MQGEEKKRRISFPLLSDMNLAEVSLSQSGSALTSQPLWPQTGSGGLQGWRGGLAVLQRAGGGGRARLLSKRRGGTAAVNAVRLYP